MNSKQRRTLFAIYAKPTRSNILWQDIESLFAALGAEISQRKGSRVGVALNGFHGLFHRPHPKKEANKGTVESVRKLLDNAGITLTNEEESEDQAATD